VARESRRGRHEQVGLGLRPRDVAAFDDESFPAGCRAIRAKPDLGTPPGGRDRVRDAQVAKPFQQVDGAGKGTARCGYDAKDLAVTFL